MSDVGNTTKKSCLDSFRQSNRDKEVSNYATDKGKRQNR